MPVPLFACMIAAAIRYDVPARVLPVIWEMEHGRNGMIHKNSNGSADLGLMQINTLWLRPLAQMTRMPEAQVAAKLVLDGCFNVAASAVIVRYYLNETHGDIMKAIGNYHSHTLDKNQKYQSEYLEKEKRLFGG